MTSRLASSPRWQQLRSQIPVAQRWAYFDHAAVAPLPAPSRAAVTEWAEQAARDGLTVWPQWVRRVEQLRTQAAALIGAAAEEIALVPNTTSGISLVAEGYPWQSGDNVVTLANEFPSNVYPWLNLRDRGVETRRIPMPGGQLDLSQIDQACDARTRLITLSWVGYASGLRADLDAVVELARKRGALLMVDAIQALGVFPLNVQRTPIDFLAADGHKWLMGPEGAGLLYVRREHLDRLRPLGVGWHSVVHSHDFSHIELRLRPTAMRYEGGSQNIVGLLGLAASLDLLVEYGSSADGHDMADRILEVTDAACERLERLGAELHSDRRGPRRSGIVSFSLANTDPQEVRQRCLEAQVVLSCRDGRLRISPHAYTNDDDLDRLVDALDRARRQPA